LRTAEFDLLASCCRLAFDRGYEAPSYDYDRIDWQRFLRVARFHRVQGLVWNSLWSAKAPIPEQVAQALLADTERIAATNLKAAVEMLELHSAFERAGVASLFVKGLTLGALAYPKPILKMGWDIDVLIGDGGLEKAAAELTHRGFQRMIPASSASLRTWHARRKESLWSRPNERLHVELHTRLTENRRLIPTIGINSPTRQVEIVSGTSLPTLTHDELFAYLCVHGASSLWFRLKWITDFAALTHRSKAEIESLYDRSQELGAGRAAAQALLLADTLYGTLAELSSLRERLERKAASRLLVGAAMKQLAGKVEPVEPTARRFGTAAIHYSQFLLLPGPVFKVSELVRQLRTGLA
jgi:hypothetical protein